MRIETTERELFQSYLNRSAIWFVHPEMEASVEQNTDQPIKSPSDEEKANSTECGTKSPKAASLSPRSSKEGKQLNQSQGKNNSRNGSKDAEPSVGLPVSQVTRRNVGKYKLVRTIGKGNFAKVKLAIHMATGVEVKLL